MSLIQIVSGLPPKIDGIGDYALQLARQLRERHQLISSFIVADPSWNGEAVEGFGTTRLASASTQGLLASIAAAREGLGTKDGKILLHFSPYAYQKRGCPFWLAYALEEFEKREPAQLNVVFHELEVTRGRPWSSTFWIPEMQRWIIGRVARLGRFQYTNIELYRGKLESWGSGRMEMFPNFSGLGEPRVNPPFAQRRNDLIIFGRAQQRHWTYEWGGKLIPEVCRMIGAERIVDIGPAMGGAARREIGGIPILTCGRLASEVVDDWMAKSLATYTYYPLQFIGKSSGFAASCACGAIPFVFDDQPVQRSCPGMVPGEDFVAVPFGRSDRPLPPLEQLSQMVFDKYQARASWALADRVARALR